MTGIYQIVCRTTGKRYIGSTWSKRGFENRWAVHRKSLCEGKHSSPHLQLSWNKYGAEDFLFLVLDILPPEKAICLTREQTYFDSVPRETLLNAKSFAAGGGMQGKKQSAETRIKQSQSAVGRSMSDETRQRISSSKKGIKTQEYTEERAMKISQKLKEAWARRKNGQN